MKLSELLQYDLSGEKANFKREDVRFSVFSNRQVIFLQEAAYAHSINIYFADENFNKISDQKLLAGTDYLYDGVAEKTCRDYASESKARVLYAKWPYVKTEDQFAADNKDYYSYNEYSETYYKDTNVSAGDDLSGKKYFEKVTGGWNSMLVDKIQMLIEGTPSDQKKIVVEYQALKQSSTEIIGDGEGPLYSPGLMRTVIEKINELEFDRVTNNVALNETYTAGLAIDLTGRKPENFIKNERHVVDTSTDKFIIRPINGSFYRMDGNNLKLVFVDAAENQTTLTQETGSGNGDYEVIGVNYAKTSMSEPTGGVYEFIALKKKFIGTVVLDYHAFGGEVSVADMTQLKADVLTIANRLNNNGILTEENLPKSILIANMLDRIDFLEHQLEHYRTQTFLYTSGPTDKWVNIAYVKSHPWFDSAPVPDHEVGKFQIQVQQFNQITDSTQTGPTLNSVKTRSSLDLEFKFSYEPVRNGSSNNITGMILKTKEVHMSHPTYEDNGIMYYYQRLTPKFRVITNATLPGSSTPSIKNGVMIQMSLTGMLENQCMVSVSDKTSAKSPWTLVDSQNNERYDQSTETQFNNATWSSETGLISNVVPVYGNGYSVFNGSLRVADVNVNYTNDSYNYGDAETTMANASDTTIIPSTCFIPELIGDEIRKIRVHILDRFNQEIIADTKALSKGLVNNVPCVTGSIMYYTDDMCSLTISIFCGESPMVGIKGFCGTNSLKNDRFYITGIDIL